GWIGFGYGTWSSIGVVPGFYETGSASRLHQIARKYHARWISEACVSAQCREYQSPPTWAVSGHRAVCIGLLWPYQSTFVSLFSSVGKCLKYPIFEKRGPCDCGCS